MANGVLMHSQSVLVSSTAVFANDLPLATTEGNLKATVRMLLSTACDEQVLVPPHMEHSTLELHNKEGLTMTGTQPNSSLQVNSVLRSRSGSCFDRRFNLQNGRDGFLRPVVLWPREPDIF